MTMAPQNIVLIGGGVAAISAIETLRTEGYDGALHLVSDEAELPYDRPPLSKAYLSGEAALPTILLHDAAWYDSQRVTLSLGQAVASIDVAGQALQLQGGGRLAFDRLLIATGARARTLPASVVAADVPQHVVRTRADADGLRHTVRPGARAVLVGGGVIGMEVAATLVQQGCEVTVLEAGDRVMARFFPPKLSALLAAVHAGEGVKIRTGVGIMAITQRGAVSFISLADGSTLEAEVLVVGVGATPNSELAEAAGLRLRLQGIEVDDAAMTSAPNLYAAGDVATFRLPGHDWARWENWTHARLQAAHAARHMLGKGLAYTELPWVWSDQYDMNLQVLGSPVSDDPVVLRGSLEGGRLAAFHRRDGRLIGATLVNDGKHKSAVRKLVEKGALVPPEQLADPAVDLKKLAAQA